jgi:hypothetical protein
MLQKPAFEPKIQLSEQFFPRCKSRIAIGIGGGNARKALIMSGLISELTLLKE